MPASPTPPVLAPRLKLADAKVTSRDPRSADNAEPMAAAAGGGARIACGNASTASVRSIFAPAAKFDAELFRRGKPAAASALDHYGCLDGCSREGEKLPSTGQTKTQSATSETGQRALAGAAIPARCWYRAHSVKFADQPSLRFNLTD